MRRMPIAKPPADAHGRCRPGALLILAGGADGGPTAGINLDILTRHGQRLLKVGLAWYDRTPPAERITWGGLAACAVLGLMVAMGRSWAIRRGRVLPAKFVGRFGERLRAGKLDKGKGTDLCELNPCPAARVALAAVRRWGRPAGDLERAVDLARQVEADRLRRHVGTLRRVAAMAPLVGLLGTLMSAGRALATPGGTPGAAWGPALAHALAPLTAGVAVAILALVAYDGLAGRVEGLANELDRLGAETIDAIMMAATPEPAGPARGPHAYQPHQVRIDLPAVEPRVPGDD